MPGSWVDNKLPVTGKQFRAERRKKGGGKQCLGNHTFTGFVRMGSGSLRWSVALAQATAAS